MELKLPHRSHVLLLFVLIIAVAVGALRGLIRHREEAGRAGRQDLAWAPALKRVRRHERAADNAFAYRNSHRRTNGLLSGKMLVVNKLNLSAQDVHWVKGVHID